MIRALVMDSTAANMLVHGAGNSLEWHGDFQIDTPEILRIVVNQIVYLLGMRARPSSRLFVISNREGGPLSALPPSARQECFLRLVRAALSQFWPGSVKLPIEWRIFHSGSLLSFQSNRLASNIKSRVYIDVKPEGTDHVYAFHLSTSGTAPLDRINYDTDLFEDASLGYEEALKKCSALDPQKGPRLGQNTFDLEEKFADANISQGVPFKVWRDAKLVKRQRDFFDAPFDSPLRIKGPAGTGKTLVLVMRFLKEIYKRIDLGEPVRACFLAHGDETADHIVQYLTQIDERGLFFNVEQMRGVEIEVGTLHSLANRFINTDAENIQPLSLDGNEGRILQLELIESLVSDFALNWAAKNSEGCRDEFRNGLISPRNSPANRAFCLDLSDEFANVLEALGVRGLDEIADRYLKSRPSERSLAKVIAEKNVVLDLYRQFRVQLFEMGVVSLDQFTADFLAYLNSFRWDALRKEKGFDFVFADELHLFNAQERRVLGYLLRSSGHGKRVAVAYDPRQSPRNSFFPEAVSGRDTIWAEAGLASDTSAFELSEIFRYTPAILQFLERLNAYFPGDDLAEDWSLMFGESQVDDGPKPRASEFKNRSEMLNTVVDRAKHYVRNSQKDEQVAVLCLDPHLFSDYISSRHFENGFAIIAGRDEIGSASRFRKRAILSMPEYVAGLQFTTVLLVDMNAGLVAELGVGINGLHRFISSAYLGASRAKITLEMFANLAAGGFAVPLKDAVRDGIVEPL